METVYGIGIDLVEIDRIAQSVERHGEHFLNRLFTQGEIAYCEGLKGQARYQSYAARFAAKEAISKALRCGLGPEFDWVDLEIKRASSGAPSVALNGRAHEYAQRHRVSRVLVSLSHTRIHAIAQATAFGAND